MNGDGLSGAADEGKAALREWYGTHEGVVTESQAGWKVEFPHREVAEKVSFSSDMAACLAQGENGG